MNRKVLYGEGGMMIESEQILKFTENTEGHEDSKALFPDPTNKLVMVVSTDK